MKPKQYIPLLATALVLLGVSQSHAADITWADSTGNTTWTTDNTANSTPASASWVGGFAPANSSSTDNAIFTSVANAQPNLTVQTRIASVDFRMADGGLSMTGNNNLFQLGTGGINSTLQTSGTNTITNTRIFLNNSSTWNLFSDTDTASTSTFTFDSSVNLNGQTLTVTGQRNSAAGNVGVINFERAITGATSTNAGALTINSSSANNSVNLTGVNTYLGVTNVNGGIVNVSNNQSAATGGWDIQTPDTVGVPVATVNFLSGSTIAVDAANKIQIGRAANSGQSFASTLNVAGTVNNDGTLQMERASTLNLNSGAAWNQDGNMVITARGGNQATVNVNAGAAMTYTGTATVKLNRAANSGGVGGLSIDSTGIFTTGRGFEATVNTGTANGNGRVTLTNGGTLKLSSNVTDLSTEVHFELGAGGGVIDNSGFNATLSGVVTGLYGINRTGITGTGGLTSTGGGTLTLTGDNTYTGATLVSAGTLLVNGSLAAGSAVTVGANGILGGNGTIGGSLSFLQNSSFRIADINAALTVDGTVTFGSGFGIANLTGIDWSLLNLNTGYTLISTTQTFTALDIGNFGLANAVAVGGGRQAYFQDGSLQLVVIPEPSTWALLGIGLATLAVFRRRRA